MRGIILLFISIVIVPGLSTAEQLEKWCGVNDPSDIRFTNVTTTMDGYTRCGEVSTVTLCDPLGRKYFGPAGDVPSSNYKDCSIGPRIYVEKDGIPVDVADAMRYKPDPTRLNKSNNSTSDEIPSVNYSLDAYYDLMDQLMAKSQGGASGDEVLGQSPALENLDRMLEPLLKGMFAQTGNGLKDEQDFKNITENFRKRIKTYKIDEDFFAD